jgi:hypothetical protein
MALPVEAKAEVVSAPAVASNGWANASLRSDEVEGMPLKAASYDDYTTHTHAHAATAAPRNGKRQYGTVFNAAQHEQSFRNGMRPSEDQVGLEAPQPAYEEEEVDSAQEIQQMKMQYKRADGTEISRRLPAVA